MNYVRNSVKATVDAYDGTVKFYVVDQTDPIIKTYRKAFPELFNDLSAMPSDLRAHLRYPEDIFSAQTEQYALYHITIRSNTSTSKRSGTFAPTPDVSSAAPCTGRPAARTAAAATRRGVGRLARSSRCISRSRTEGAEAGRALAGQFLLERAFTPRLKAQFSPPSSSRSRMATTTASSSCTRYPTRPRPRQSSGTLIQSDQFISSQFTLLGSSVSKVIQGDVQLLPIATRSCTSGRSGSSGEGIRPSRVTSSLPPRLISAPCSGAT